MALLRRGDATAQEELVRTHAGRMVAVIRRILRDEESSQDALQDAFLCAFRSLGAFGGRARLSTWLHRIAINAALMRLRKQRRRAAHEVSIGDLLPRFDATGHRAAPEAAWGERAERALERQETRDAVRRAIDLLPEGYRVVLLLRDIEELDGAETARVLGMTTNAVKVRLHRARQALRTLLDPILAP